MSGDDARRYLGRAGTVVLVALTWAVTWAGVAFAVLVAGGFIDPAAIDAGEGPVDLLPTIAMTGFVGGVGFGLLMAIAERGRPIAAVPIWRALVWGAVAGVGLSLLAVTNANEANTAILGVAAAVVTIGIARVRRRIRPAARTSA
jgi:FtsH-binding integral membrane protein